MPPIMPLCIPVQQTTEEVPTSKNRKFCYGCFRESTPEPPLLQCQKCRIALFCTRDCQKHVHPYHKQSCLENTLLAKMHAYYQTLNGVQCLRQLQTALFTPYREAEKDKSTALNFVFAMSRIRSQLINYCVGQGKSGHFGGFDDEDEEDGLGMEIGEFGLQLHQTAMRCFMSTDKMRELWASFR